MKKTTHITLLLFLCVFGSRAQVGIGTQNPSEDLHVVGDIIVQEEFEIDNLNQVSPTEEDFKFLARTKNSNPAGEIKVLDVDDLNVAPITIVDYNFTDVYLDNLTDVNLQFDATKYIVGITNYRQTGDAIKKSSAWPTKSIGNLVIRAFISGGTWHLEIRNRDLDLSAGDSLEYKVTLVVYDKKYFKSLPPISTNLGGSNSGTASAVPTLN